MSLAANQRAERRSNESLIRCREARGWSLNRAAHELAKIGEEHKLPVPREQSSILTQLKRHERGTTAPRNADDPYVQLYRIGYGVDDVTQLFPQLTKAPSADGGFGVASHKFVPVYVGPDVDQLAGLLDAEPTELGATPCHVIDVDQGDAAGRLYLFGWGVAVLHVTDRLRPASIAELAVWRRTTHRAARHALTVYLTGLLGRDVTCRYVLSCYWLHEPAWTGVDLRTAMRLLCMPRALLSTGDDGHAGALAYSTAIEQRLFQEGFAPVDQVDCGVDGVSLAWASWAGVAYHPLQPRAALQENDLVRLELQVQALWALCDEVEQQVQAGSDPVMVDGYDWRWLRARRLEITNAAPTEPQQLRMLRTAVLQTSELTTKLGSAVELLKEIQ